MIAWRCAVVRRVQVGLDDVEPALHVEQLLRLRQRDQHLFAARQGRPGSRPTISSLATPSVVGMRSVSPSFSPSWSARLVPDHRHVAVALLQEAPFGGGVVVQQRAGDRIDADQRQAGHARVAAVEVGRQVHRPRDRAGQRPRTPSTFLTLSSDAGGESLAGLVGDGHVRLPGEGEDALLERLHHGRHHRTHAEDDHHADDDGQGRQERAQLAAPQIAGGQR